ncbi:DUF2892 domain-containing protein [Aquincola sp. MAHUQ-54]|uniref:DUF2892 domain-containing protein n=1 Tax=Aquincola agrisoli TaxID=3119538 RepID=A0AAW9QB24_9BURK
MNRNMGRLDRLLRFAIGMSLLGATAAGLIGTWGVIGAVPVLTSLVGICPLYALLHINTCPRKID